MQNYYDPTSTEAAARLMLEVADKYKGNNNFEYDLVDIVRQSLSDRGRIVYNQTIADFKSFDKKNFAAHSQEFLNILLAQDRLLGTRSEFRVGVGLNRPATSELLQRKRFVRMECPRTDYHMGKPRMCQRRRSS